MYIRADGSFSGEYHDSDMGSVGPGYPGGTMYQCVFTASWENRNRSMTILTLPHQFPAL